MSRGTYEKRFFISDAEKRERECERAGCDSNSAGSQAEEEKLSFSERFYKHILPEYLAIGVPEERIMDGTPNDLKPFSEAYSIKMKMEDERMWMQGQYFLFAIMHGMSRLSKKGKNIDYPDKPILENQTEKPKEENLTEDKKKREREKLLMSLQIMQSNFDRIHKKEE